MQRRTLLQSIALLGAGSLAGCTAGEQVVGEKTTTLGPVEPEIGGTDFAVLDQGCGNEVNEATVELGSDAVEITGTIAGSDACKTAELADATYDPNADELRVTVGTVDREGAGACAQCIVEIDYRASVQFTGGLPPNVVVRHDGVGEPGVVATVKRAAEGSGSDTPTGSG
jgi:hypothetical protein